MARAGQMLCLGGTIEKGIYYVDGLCAIHILLGRISDTPLAGYYKPGGLIPKGFYMPLLSIRHVKLQSRDITKSIITCYLLEIVCSVC